MNRDKLKEAFKKAKEGRYDFVGVAIKTPINTEVVLVPYEYLNQKLDFYLDAYKPSMEHFMSDSVKIIGAKPLMSNEATYLLEHSEKLI